MSDQRAMQKSRGDSHGSTVGDHTMAVEPPWFDDRDDDVQQARRRWLVIAAAVVPWTIVLTLLVVRGGDEPDPIEAPASSLGDGQESLLHDHPPMSSGGELTVHQLQGNWRSSPGTDAAAAVAIMIARSWITGVPPQLDVIGRPEAHIAMYAEHLAVEAVEQVDQTLAVVTVLASVIDGDLGVTVRRLAVPVWTGRSTVHPAGQPWWLPELALDATPLEGEIITDPQVMLAAAEALSDAGYAEVELIQLERTAAWPWRATVRATTPVGQPVTTPVLLRRHVDRFVVAGTVISNDQPAIDNANIGAGRFLP